MKYLLLPFMLTLSLLLACGKDSDESSDHRQTEEDIPAGTMALKCYSLNATGALTYNSQVRQTDSRLSYYHCQEAPCRWQRDLIRFIEGTGHENDICLGESELPGSFRMCTGDAIESRETQFGTLVYLGASEFESTTEFWCEEKILNILFIH